MIRQPILRKHSWWTEVGVYWPDLTPIFFGGRSEETSFFLWYIFSLFPVLDSNLGGGARRGGCAPIARWCASSTPVSATCCMTVAIAEHCLVLLQEGSELLSAKASSVKCRGRIAFDSASLLLFSCSKLNLLDNSWTHVVNSSSVNRLMANLKTHRFVCYCSWMRGCNANG